jgi:anti-sigma-K factor RskA
VNERHSKAMQRLHELLAEHELGRLEPSERAELDALLASDDILGVDVDAEAEAIAASIALTHAALAAPLREELPDAVRERVLAGAARHFGWNAQAKPSAPSVQAAPRAARRETRGPTRAATPASSPATNPWFARTGWLVAAAAAAALAVVLTRPEPLPAAPESRDAFVARVADEIVVPWTPTADPLGAGVSGDVVWSPSEQKGFMRFRGLSVNDKTANQYQLWIIDAAREGESPVDGGVFDCPSNGEIVVPIDAKLAVGQPAAFAITLEKPGGVVVSKQEHLFLLAAVGS